MNLMSIFYKAGLFERQESDSSLPVCSHTMPIVEVILKHPTFFPVENHCLRLGSADSFLSRFTLQTVSVHMEGPGLMKPMGQHRPQKAKIKACGSQTRLPLAPFCHLFFFVLSSKLGACQLHVRTVCENLFPHTWHRAEMWSKDSLKSAITVKIIVTTKATNPKSGNKCCYDMLWLWLCAISI